MVIMGGGRSGDAWGVSQEDGEEFPDGRLTGAGLGQRQVDLDLVVVAAAVFRLGHVARLDQVSENTVSRALGDAQTDSDVTQSKPDCRWPRIIFRRSPQQLHSPSICGFSDRRGE
jgi:hypothetical protein